MKTKSHFFFMTIASVLFLSPAFAQDNWDYKTLTGEQKKTMIEQGKEIIKTGDCLNCHRIDQKLTGPSYKEVAKRYAPTTDTQTINTLAEKIIKGGNKNWGFTKMTAHPDMTMEQARQAVMAILSLEEEKK